MDEITLYLGVFKYYVELHNEIGNVDINKSSENFFCGLLNLVFDIKLRNLNRLQMNFPAIDLGDTERRVCYQITATSTSHKIRATLDKFKEKELYKEFDEINILIIGNKKKHNGNFQYLDFNFDISENLIDINDLSKEIAKKDTDGLEKIVTFFKSELSNSIIDKIRIVKEDKAIYIEEKILRDKHTCYYAFGLGRVRIDAFLPISNDQKLSCLILFQQPGLSDCMISFDEDFIKNVLFNDCDSGLTENRGFIWYMDRDKVGIKFPNIRFTADLITARQLCEIISRLHIQYSKIRTELIEVVGAVGFKEESPGEYRILRVPRSIWTEMVDFAQAHDHYYGETEWDIFRPLHSVRKDRIMIYKNHMNKINADILAELYVSDLSSTSVNIVWKAGYTPFISKMDGFNNQIKWKVDFTHNWIIEMFIPYIIYLGHVRNQSIIKRLFMKKINFEKFKSDFSLKPYYIESLACGTQ